MSYVFSMGRLTRYNRTIIPKSSDKFGDVYCAKIAVLLGMKFRDILSENKNIQMKVSENLRPSPSKNSVYFLYFNFDDALPVLFVIRELVPYTSDDP